jgi:uncharacterized LabA/DUF88 family protein
MNSIIAVFIDGDNISHRDIGIILNEIKTYGRIIILRVYGDWSMDNMKNWLTKAKQYGIIPIQCERINGKNSSDIKLCVDIMKTLYTIPNISLYYLITSDSDYRHVISEIKLLDKKVNCIGNNDTNISLMSICDQFTKLEVLKGIFSEKKYIKINVKLRNLYQKEINNITEKYNSVNISLIKDVLSRKYQFDYREWGYNKMSIFLYHNFQNLKYIKDKNGNINIVNTLN